MSNQWIHLHHLRIVSIVAALGMIAPDPVQ